MTPTATGRHCPSCQHAVVDFTRMTDAEVVAFFRQAPATTCGRFADHQLDRLLLGAAPPAPRWRTWLVAAGTLLTGFLAGLSARAQTTSGATPGSQPVPTQQPRPSQQPQRPAAAPAPGSLTLRGRVLDDSTKEPIPFASLALQRLEIGLLSDEHGSFSLTVSAEQLARQPADTLLVQALGHWRHSRFLDLRSAATAPIEVLVSRPQVVLSDLHITAGLVVQLPADTARPKPAPKRPRRAGRR